MLRLGGAAVRAHPQHPEAGRGHRGQRLPDGGERRGGPFRDHIVESDHADVVRGAQAALAQGLQHTERLVVVPGHDRGGRFRHAEQAVRLAAAVRHGELAPADESLVDGQARPHQRGPVAVQPGVRRPEPLRAADRGDPAVTEAGQMAGRGHAALPVGRPDGLDVAARLGGRVDDDEGEARGGQPPAFGHVGQVEHAEHAVGAALGRVIQPRGELRGGADGRDHDAVAGLTGRVHRPPDELLGPRAVQGADQQVHHAEPHPQGDLVTVAAQQLADPCPGAGGDVGAPVEHLGHGGDRDACFGRDARQRAAAARPALHWPHPFEKSAAKRPDRHGPARTSRGGAGRPAIRSRETRR